MTAPVAPITDIRVGTDLLLEARHNIGLIMHSTLPGTELQARGVMATMHVDEMLKHLDELAERKASQRARDVERLLNEEDAS